MTGTFKFDPETQTFVFRVDNSSASVSWNRKTAEFEAWKTDQDTGAPVKLPNCPGGLFRALRTLWLEMRRAEK